MDLSRALGCPDPRVAAIEALRPELLEWSVNAEGDPRGALRLAAFSPDFEQIGQLLLRSAPALGRTHQLAPRPGHTGVGLVIGQPNRWRWWQLGPAEGSADLGRFAHTAWPHHRDALHWLAPDHRLVALGAEGGTDVVRTTLYAHLPNAATARHLLARARIPAGPEATRLFGLLGTRIWPKLWIAHSLGQAAGLKLYLFLRGDPDRPADDTPALQAVQADPRVRAAAAAFGTRAVQLIALCWPASGAPPRWTVYLAES